MKLNKVLRAMAAIFVGTAVFALAACSDSSNDALLYSGTVSFCVDKTLAQKAYELAQSISKDEPNDPNVNDAPQLRFEISLNGEYNDSMTVEATPIDGNQFSSFNVDFTGVPIGKMVFARVKAYCVWPGETPLHPALVGKSQTIQVASGLNSLSVATYLYYTEIHYTLTIQFDERPNLESLGERRIYAIDPYSKFVSKIKAAKDDVDRYEICNDFYDKYASAGCILGQIELNFNPEIPEDGNYHYDSDTKTLIVDDTMSMPVSDDEPGSKGATAHFILLGQSVSSGTFKTKYFGMTSAPVSPVKKQDNTASFSAKPLTVVDTNYALYVGGDASEYYNIKYYLKDNPADALGTESFNSSGTSDSMEPTRVQQSFCFDANGNFYALSVTPDANPVYILSTNPEVNGYECKDGDDNRIAYNSISCDLKNNELFALNRSGGSSYALFGTGSLIEGGTDAKTKYNLILDTAVFPDYNINEEFFAVYGNVAYFIVSFNYDYYLAKADLSKADLAGSNEYNVTLEKVAKIELPSDDTKITDMLYQDGAVYLIAREFNDNLTDKAYYATQLSYTSRGALIKCNVADKSVKTIGWTNDAQNNAAAGFYTYYPKASAADGKYRYFTENLAPDWNDSSKQFKIPGNASLELSGGYSVKDELPKLYSPSKAQASSAFYGPQKFIAIKPKKLVIADNGTAFYTDKGGYTCKTARRVVTVDLETFAISGSVDNAAAFETCVSANIYTNSFGTVADYVGSGKLVTDLWLDNGGGSHFTETSGTSNAIYLGIPLDEE